VLVVEGWIPKAALAHAAELSQQKHYKLILTNGGKINNRNRSKLERTYAEAARNELIRMDVDEKLIHIVNTPVINKSRTYSYALATIKWLETYCEPVKAINVITLDAHARKSYLLYRKAARNQINVGIIASPPLTYSARYWYFSKQGIGHVLRDLAGYLYACLL
jgi:hypothetical protein